MNIHRILPWFYSNTIRLMQQMEQGKVSKHAKGRTKPKGWHQTKRAKRKVAHAARIVTMRGKR